MPGCGSEKGLKDRSGDGWRDGEERKILQYRDVDCILLKSVANALGDRFYDQNGFFTRRNLISKDESGRRLSCLSAQGAHIENLSFMSHEKNGICV